MDTLVSIILPTYNGAAYIADAIESVRLQTYSTWELLVIDDGSVDDTQSIVQAYEVSDLRIKYIKNDSNLGIQKTLNKGLSLAKGTYIARIDDDDRWSAPDKLRQQVAYLEDHPDTVLVGTGAVVVDEYGTELFRYTLPQRDGDIRRALLGKNCFVHASVLFRKDAAVSCGGYSESIEQRHIEDYDLWLKLGMQGLVANLDMYGVTLIERSGSITATNRVIQAKRMRAEVILFRKKYPRFVRGYFVSYMRLVFFYIYQYLPFKDYLTPLIKAAYKRA